MSIDFPKEEEVVLQRWRDIDAFLRQVCLHATVFTMSICISLVGIFF